MTSKCFVAVGGFLTLLMITSLPARPAFAQEQQEQKPTYTLPEYNAFQAARTESNPQNRLKLLDDFVAKYPNSTLMPYVYQVYLDTYNQMKTYPKVIEYGDKLVAMGDKVQVQVRLQALVARCTAFEASYNPKAPDLQDQLTKEHDAAQQGLKLLDQLPKPQTVSDQQFADQKKPAQNFFDNAAGFASLQMKDYKASADSFKAAVAANPKDAVAYYRLGVSYLQQNPPLALDGFWELAKAINLHTPAEQQVHQYLRAQMQRYQLTGCDNLLDAEFNELLTLAQNGPDDRPASYTIASSADLDKVRQTSTILTVLTDLKTGGDKAKTTWLAVCGSEFQDVPGKIIDKTTDPSNGTIVYKLYTGATQEEMDAANQTNSAIVLSPQEGAQLTVNIPYATGAAAPGTATPGDAATPGTSTTTSGGSTATPSAGASGSPAQTPAAQGSTAGSPTGRPATISVTGEPGVDKFEKGDYFRYTGTLISYDPQPVVVYWDKAKVNPEDIPTEKSKPGEHKRAPVKKPGR